MIENKNPETPGKHRPSPIDVARVIKRMRDMQPAQEPAAPEAEPVSPEPQAGDIIERNGMQYMLAPELRTTRRWQDGHIVYGQEPYTYAQYYAHTFEEPGTGERIPGPGWDSKFRLQNEGLAIELHNRTFTPEELQQLPNNLPDTPALFVSDLEGGRVAEYQEYLEAQKQ